MANKYITINVYANGDFNYSLALLGVTANDVVTWNAGADTGNFSIAFKGGNPLSGAGPELFSKDFPGNAVVATIKDPVAAGTVYHYAVTATNKPSGTTWSDTGCPELIIR